MAAAGDGAGQGPLAKEELILDKVRLWGAIAAQQYREDGAADGWDSDASEEETAEQEYVKVLAHIAPFCNLSCMQKDPLHSHCLHAHAWHQPDLRASAHKYNKALLS